MLGAGGADFMLAPPGVELAALGAQPVDQRHEDEVVGMRVVHRAKLRQHAARLALPLDKALARVGIQEHVDQRVAVFRRHRAEIHEQLRRGIVPAQQVGTVTAHVRGQGHAGDGAAQHVGHILHQ